MTDLERTQSILAELEGGYIGYGNMHNDNNQGCYVIEDALKKQVPMKPKARLMVNECPECGLVVGDAYVTCKYCPDCGQAIDWSE